MYLTLNKKNLLLWGSLLIVFLQYKFMSLPIPIATAYGSEMRYSSWFITLFMSMLLYKDVLALNKRFVFVKYFFLYILISQVIICIYSMITYDENIIDMYICAGSYLLLLFTYILFVGMEEYGTKRFLGYFYAFAVIYMILLFVNALLVNFVGIRILTTQMTSKTDNMRAFAGALYVVFMIVLFWRVLSKEATKATILVLALGIAVELYVEQTRMYEMALFFAFFFMWYSQDKKDSVKLLRFAIVILFVVAFFGLGLHQEIINSFSIDPTVNKSARSSLARVNAIYYFSGYLIDNPLMGMGWVRPRSDYLMLIFAGPNRSAFFDDLGFLGQVFRQGILGAIIYILFIGRLIYIIAKMPKASKYRNLIIGILAFVLVSATSLNCFDGQRILGTAFLLAISEKAFDYERTKAKEGAENNEARKERSIGVVGFE